MTCEYCTQDILLETDQAQIIDEKGKRHDVCVRHVERLLERMRQQAKGPSYAWLIFRYLAWGIPLGLFLYGLINYLTFGSWLCGFYY